MSGRARHRVPADARDATPVLPGHTYRMAHADAGAPSRLGREARARPGETPRHYAPVIPSAAEDLGGAGLTTHEEPGAVPSTHGNSPAAWRRWSARYASTVRRMRPRSSSVVWRITRPGTPTTSELGGISIPSRHTVPAPTIDPLPTRTP